MKNIPNATGTHLDTIRARAYDDTARAMAGHGVRLTWDQEGELGEGATAWLADRLGLHSETDSDGVTYYPRGLGEQIETDE
jgi:hypothetical protein